MATTSDGMRGELSFEPIPRTTRNHPAIRDREAASATVIREGDHGTTVDRRRATRSKRAGRPPTPGSTGAVAGRVTRRGSRRRSRTDAADRLLARSRLAHTDSSRVADGQSEDGGGLLARRSSAVDRRLPSAHRIDRDARRRGSSGPSRGALGAREGSRCREPSSDLVHRLPDLARGPGHPRADRRGVGQQPGSTTPHRRASTGRAPDRRGIAIRLGPSRWSELSRWRRGSIEVFDRWPRPPTLTCCGTRWERASACSYRSESGSATPTGSTPSRDCSI